MIKWLRRIGLVVLAAIAVVVVLRVGFGLHVYMDGDFGLHLAFGKASAHYDALEAQRAAQRAAPPAAAPAAATAAPAAATADPAAAPQPPPSQAPPSKAGPQPAVQSAAPPAAVAGSWTDFRGPARDGVYRQRPVAATWPAGGPRLLWKQPVGVGHASFVIARGVAYTIEQRRNREVVAAYDIGTGRERWTHGWDAFFSEAMGGDGPRATPTYADGILYALGAAGELRALRADSGTLVWRTNILDDAGAENLQWGMSAAPLIVDGKVIVQPGGRGASMVAYDASDRQGGVEVARRSAGLRLADAGDARRPPPDRDHHRRSRDRRVGRRRRAAVELSVGDGQQDQHLAADRDRAVAALPLVRLWQGRRGNRADAVRRSAAGGDGLAAHADEEQAVELGAARRPHLRPGRRHPGVRRRGQRPARLEGRPLRARPAAAGRRSPADHDRDRRAGPGARDAGALRGAGARARDRGPHLERSGHRRRHPARP